MLQLPLCFGNDDCFDACGRYLHSTRFSHTLVGHMRRTAVFDISMTNLCVFAFECSFERGNCLGRRPTDIFCLKAHAGRHVATNSGLLILVGDILCVICGCLCLFGTDSLGIPRFVHASSL